MSARVGTVEGQGMKCQGNRFYPTSKTNKLLFWVCLTKWWNRIASLKVFKQRLERVLRASHERVLLIARGPFLLADGASTLSPPASVFAFAWPHTAGTVYQGTWDRSHSSFWSHYSFPALSHAGVSLCPSRSSPLMERLNQIYSMALSRSQISSF